MVMLSELLQYRVTDGEGDSIKLTDLAISQLDQDYPLVTHVIFHSMNQRKERVLPWKQV